MNDFSISKSLQGLFFRFRERTDADLEVADGDAKGVDLRQAAFALERLDAPVLVEVNAVEQRVGVVGRLAQLGLDAGEVVDGEELALAVDDLRSSSRAR